MKIAVEEKYLTLPVNTQKASKKVMLFLEGVLVYDLDCCVDMLDPNFTAYIDVERFMGKEIEIEISPEMNFSVGKANTVGGADLYREPLRPQIHFTVPNGWNNDPNGMVKYNGVYHMFYQFNPCAAVWGNMHWGHATSRDLIHWEDHGIAMFPDELGTMYSGSAIEDTEDLLGKRRDGKNALLFYYTAAGRHGLLAGGGKMNTQCLAISTDGGMTLEKYAGNPILNTLTPHNRDPKVVYVDELGAYIMALYLERDEYRLFKSNDLINWEQYSVFHIEGDKECPDIYPLNLDGKKLWVVSGAHDRYVTGSFTEEGFVINTEPKPLTYSSLAYAAQSFTGIDDGRTIRAIWDKLHLPCPTFSEQMAIPTEMSLERHGSDIYLAAKPVREIELLRKESHVFTDLALEDEVFLGTGAAPLDVLLEFALQDGAVTLSFFGSELTFDAKENAVKYKNMSMPLSLNRDKASLRVLIDQGSLTVFADNGKFCTTQMLICDFNLPYLTLTADRKTVIERFECHILASIYDKK